MNDEELRRRIAERARQLWEEAGRPEGRDMEYWLQAEEELAPLSVAGEEDPMEALDHDPPGTLGKGQIIVAEPSAFGSGIGGFRKQLCGATSWVRGAAG
jgi:hypothetical protein